MSNPAVELPNKLWQLLELSINSAKELDPTKYRLNMGLWYLKPVDDSTCFVFGTRCSVCMAGAVMVSVLGSDQAGAVMPSMFDSDTEDKLRVINFLREGKIAVAREYLAHEFSDPELCTLVREVDRNILMGAIACKETPWLDNWSAHLALLGELKRLDL